MQEPQRFLNRLAKEKSPYLLQHAGNPVDWYPWGKEAFEKAKRENRPIFLSIGYSTCHWCHVMEHESFEDQAIASVLNRFFVPVKVDREERPDVDRVYMTFVQATTGGGGWPLSVWLTPDLKPFVGGTYFPPEDRYGRMGFLSVLQKISEAWSKDQERLAASGDEVLKALSHAASRERGEAEPSVQISDQLFTHLQASFDEEYGGFGDAPKFPRPVTLSFLFRYWHRTREEKALRMVERTLDCMAAGGMNDHLGGGFHRYSVDARWHVPHFEKMLYDQAQLAISYLEMLQISGEARHERVARGILDYVLREMTSTTGGFFSAEDADSDVPGSNERGEGAFYIWSKDEIEAALSPSDAKVFCRHYGVESGGNTPVESDPHGEFTGKNILVERYTIAETAKICGTTEEDAAASLARAKSILFEIRASRPRPHLDDKIITAWNGLMISAFAKGAQVLDDEHYRETAVAAAKFLRKQPKLVRCYREGPSGIEGFADDYAFLIQGLLDLYEATFDTRWLAWALELQDAMDERFLDHENGGYYSVTGSDPSILLRMKEDNDGAEPSSNSVACLNLLRLAQICGEPRYAETARRALSAFGNVLQRMPAALPLMVCALEASIAKPVQIVVVGAADDHRVEGLLQVALRPYRPDRIVLLADGAEGQRWLGQRLEFIRTVRPPGEEPAAYVCENFTCHEPVKSPEELKKAICSPV